MDNTTAKVSCFARAYHFENNKTHIFADSMAARLLGDDYDHIAESLIEGISFFLPGFEGTQEFYYRCHHRKRADGKLCDFAPKLNQDKFNSEVEDVIRYMVREGRFREYMKSKLDEQVDVSYLEDEKKQLQGQMQQVQGAKKKLLQMIDRLDSGDRHYDQKYQDMSDRLDNLYDRISELDEEVAGVDARIQAAYEKQITGKNVYQFLLDFDTLYERMTDLEKKQFMGTFIESIELYQEKKDNGRILPCITVFFPLDFLPLVEYNKIQLEMANYF